MSRPCSYLFAKYSVTTTLLAAGCFFGNLLFHGQPSHLKNIDMEFFLEYLLKRPLFSSPSASPESRLRQCDEIVLVLDRHAPLITRRVILRPLYPWVGPDELAALSKLHKLKIIARRSKRKWDWCQFHSERLAFRRTMRLAREAF